MTALQLVERGPVRIYTPGVARAMLRHESQRVALADRLRALYRDSALEKRNANGRLVLNLGFDNGVLSSSPVVTPINWATFFAGAYQVIDTSIGFTYGATMLAGGSATDAVALTGVPPATRIPILVKGTGAGTCDIFYDGGTTAAMTGVTPSAGAPIALTGAGSPLSLTWTAATIALGNTWTATYANLQDQILTAHKYVQAAASKQPIVAPGLNGKVTALLDGTDDELIASTPAGFLPAPGTTPYSMYMVFRQISWVNGKFLTCDSGAFTKVFQSGSTPQLFARTFNTGPGNVGAPLNTWVILEVARANSAGDIFKLGTSTVTATQGNTASALNLTIGSSTGAAFAKMELALLVYTPVAIDVAAFRAALNSSAGYGAGSILV